MTKTTIIGQLVTATGENCQSYFSSDPAHLWSPIRRRIWAIPAAEVRSVQAPEIPLRLNHGEAPAGRIVHLERRPSDGSVWAVAELDQDIHPDPDTDYFLSVEATWDEGTGANVEINGAALCAKSAMIGLQPVTFLRDGLDQRGRATWRLGTFQQELLKRSRSSRRAGAPIVVAESVSEYERETGRIHPALVAEVVEEQHWAWKNRPLEYRPSRIISVR